MPTGLQKSYCAKKNEVKRDWYHVDASGQILGRLASQIATVLMGKHKATYTAHVDTGDFVVVTNADKIKLTGDKLNTMKYARYTYYQGGYKVDPVKKVLQNHPERVLRMAVKRMMPKNALAVHMLSKLKIYASADHPHAVNAPKPWSLTHAARTGLN